MKTKITVLVESLEKAVNLVTPDENGFNPISDTSDVGAYSELGYRLGRALTMARALKREG